MPNWIQWSLEVLPAHADASANILHEAGCAGVQIDDVAVVLDESEDASFVPRETARLCGYADLETLGLSEFEMCVAIERALQSAQIETELKGENLDESDWANQWRENFPPLQIGRFRIVPSWEPTEPSSEVEIQLDPGLAFGTGQHPTTRMCLEMLGQEMQRREPSPSTSSTSSTWGASSTCTVLDVGCGSGILSIAAAKLGAQVTASDLDEWCIAATEENAARNNVKLEVALAAGAAWTPRTFDIVLANLMSEVLISLAPDLRARCHATSTCIVSGISIQRADDVARALENVGLQVLERRVEAGESRGEYVEEWAALRLQVGCRPEARSRKTRA